MLRKVKLQKNSASTTRHQYPRPVPTFLTTGFTDEWNFLNNFSPRSERFPKCVSRLRMIHPQNNLWPVYPLMAQVLRK